MSFRRNLAQIYKRDPGLVHQVLFATFIFGSNVAHIPSSLRKIPEDKKGVRTIRMICASTFKGFVYGAFYPFTPMFICLDFFDKDDIFMKHFVPCSVYGKLDDETSR